MLDLLVRPADYGVGCISSELVSYIPGLKCSGAFLPVHVVWRHDKMRLESRKEDTRHDLYKELNFGTLMDPWGVARFLEFRQNVDD